MAIINNIHRNSNNKLLIILNIFVILTITLIAFSIFAYGGDFTSVFSLSHKKINDNTINSLQNIEQLPNETVLIDSTDRTLADAIANKINLLIYLTPKNSDFIISNGHWTIEQLNEKFPNIVQRISTDNAYNN
ncbi:MAG TPA: hypothetical protein VN703_05660, partial [Candidatus Sulfopaludibacter sp.]|nr:hypothetical protein [Candidatus Sulfopaludibacter sp.]